MVFFRWDSPNIAAVETAECQRECFILHMQSHGIVCTDGKRANRAGYAEKAFNWTEICNRKSTAIRYVYDDCWRSSTAPFSGSCKSRFDGIRWCANSRPGEGRIQPRCRTGDSRRFYESPLPACFPCRQTHTNGDRNRRRSRFYELCSSGIGRKNIWWLAEKNRFRYWCGRNSGIDCHSSAR